MVKINKRGLKTNRSVWKYIFFGIITLGIYDLVLIHEMARDLNRIGEGDGSKPTAGLLKCILLSCVTLGIYWFIWIYSFQERMADNASRYSVNVRESGAVVLLWSLLGALALGIGPFVAMHMMLSNLNKLAKAYNQKNGLNDAETE